MSDAERVALDAPERCPHCTSWTEVEPQIFMCRRDTVYAVDIERALGLVAAGPRPAKLGQNEVAS